MGGGAREGTFEAEKFTIDVTKSPVPRFDLLKFEHYLYVGVQFSRGCPFTCEFCDIIELYGRAPQLPRTLLLVVTRGQPWPAPPLFTDGGPRPGVIIASGPDEDADLHCRGSNHGTCSWVSG